MDELTIVTGGWVRTWPVMKQYPYQTCDMLYLCIERDTINKVTNTSAEKIT